MRERNLKNSKRPNLKLIQGGKSDSKATSKPAAKKMSMGRKEKMAAAKPEKRTHPFAHFFEKSRNGSVSYMNSRQPALSHQIPRKKAM